MGILGKVLICIAVIGVLILLNNISYFFGEGVKSIKNGIKTSGGNEVKAAKEEGRLYVYGDRCSFKLPEEKLDFLKVADDGLETGLHTASLGMVSIRIHSGDPNAACMVNNPTYTATGLPFWAEKHTMTNMVFYYIKCPGFYLEVICDPDKDTLGFIQSLRMESVGL